MVEGSVVGGSVALSEKVGLDLDGVSSKPFPINLIQIVRLHHETADNSGATGCLQNHADFAKEDVIGTGDCWGLSLDSHDEVGTICAVVCHGSTLGIGEVVALALSEVDSDSFTESSVGRT